MQIWYLIILSLIISSILFTLLRSKPTHKYPPGPFAFPIIAGFFYFFKSLLEFEDTLRKLHAKFGPIVTLRIGPRPIIFIADRSVAYKALIQNGISFADRPARHAAKKLRFKEMDIGFMAYGKTWSVLRRNLSSEILRPASLKSFAPTRRWVFENLFDHLTYQSKSGRGIVDVEVIFQRALFSLSVFMCFGYKLEEKKIEEIQLLVNRMIFGSQRFRILNFWQKLCKVFLRKHRTESLSTRRHLDKVLISLIEDRKKAKQSDHRQNKDEEQEEEESVVSYVDTLLDLQLPEEKRNLYSDEISSLCSEFLSGGTYTTCSSLQWIMANMVKYPHIQNKLYAEIERVLESGREEVKEKDLSKLPYLKAIVLEALRRHPPSHFLLPHAVKEDLIFNGNLIPKKAIVNFMVSDMGRDPEIWEDPMEFKPERFLNGGEKKENEVLFDITSSKEIKMMPFGAGQRMCPGFGLAILHLEYFVANLVWRFEWKPVNGDDIDLSEKLDLLCEMNKPLQAEITARLSCTRVDDAKSI